MVKVVYSLGNMTRPVRQDYITTQEAATIMGHTVQHMRLLFREGKVRATKLGRDWLVARPDLEQRRALRRQRTRYTSIADQAEDSHRAPVVAETLPGFADYPTRRERGGAVTGVNVAQVPQRSPFRYPGGKTWLIPYARQWLRSLGQPVAHLLEPFAGGGIVSLTAVFEGLVKRATMVELDEDVAAVWHTIFNGDVPSLTKRMMTFQPSPDSVRRVLAHPPTSVGQRAFATIVRNRVARGGILAPGAGLVKRGENGRGLSSRWYATTLCRRILAIAAFRNRIHFIEGDGLDILRAYARQPDCAFFIDPPYTVAGRRLYKYSEIDHPRLFDLALSLRGDFLMTYDDAEEIRALAASHGFQTRVITMKTTHHTAKRELLIARAMDWLKG